MIISEHLIRPWTLICQRVLATRRARVVPGRLPLRDERAQGRPGARCTRGLVCNVHKEVRTRAYWSSGEHPAFPAQWLYGLYRALPGDEFLIDSVATGQLLTVRQLDACHGRQDHTPLPYASVALRLRNISVHRSPPNVRDDGRRPSDQDGMAKNEPLIWPSDKAKYFSFRGLTRFPNNRNDLPRLSRRTSRQPPWSEGRLRRVTRLRRARPSAD